MQLLHLIVIHCDSKTTAATIKMAKHSKLMRKNLKNSMLPKRSAAAVAEQTIRDIACNKTQ